MNDKPKASFSTIDEYIALQPGTVQPLLQQLRQTIQQTAPEAVETINYQIPTFKFHGNLVHFAAFKNHIGFYPGPSGIEHFQLELDAHETAKGSVKFPLDKPIPYDLVGEIVRFRVQENLEKIAKKSKKKT